MVVKGKKLTIKEQWQKLKDELKGMTPKQRLEHLWEYYKWVLGVLFAVVIIVGTIIGSIISLNTETIIAGAIINVPVNMEGFVQLQDGYYQHAKTEGRQAVALTNFTFLDPYTNVEQTYTLDIIESVTAMIGSDNLDYVLYDDLALTFFMTPEFFTDLRELFTEEELAAMGNAVIKLQIPETGEVIPLAIDIRDTVFYDRYIEEGWPIYLSFSVRLPRKDACRDFWQYIKGGNTDDLETVIAGSLVDVELDDKGKAVLKQDFFAAQECTLGDDRVELTEQSFRSNVDYEGEDLAPLVKANVLRTLKDGSLDYVLCDEEALQQLEKADLLDLRQLLTETQLAQLQDALVVSGDIPVAVDLSGLTFGQEFAEGEPVYLAFSAKTERLQACKDLWNMIYAK